MLLGKGALIEARGKVSNFIDWFYLRFIKTYQSYISLNNMWLFICLNFLLLSCYWFLPYI
jgi:hypothetical protein